MLGATDSAAQLIEIGEAEPIGAINDDCICVRNIQTAFDNRSANEHVDFSGDESRHHSFQFIGIHLAMSDFNSGLRAKMANSLPRPLDGRNAIMQEEHLPLALQFSIDGSANDPLIIGRHDCFYGEAIER